MIYRFILFSFFIFPTHLFAHNIATLNLNFIYEKSIHYNKFMENFIKESAYRHKLFEKSMKAREKHKMDLSHYGVTGVIEETKTTTTSTGTTKTTSSGSSSGINQQLEKLYDLYKEGALTEEEFQKAKDKVLNQ